MIRREDVTVPVGRHADPIAVAEAVVWFEDLRFRALVLCNELDQRNAMPVTEDDILTYTRFVMGWADRARVVLEQVTRG